MFIKIGVQEEIQKWVSEAGATVTIAFYRNDTASTEGAIPMEVVRGGGGRNGVNEEGPYVVAGYVPTKGLPAGEHYVYCVLTATADDDPAKTASTTSDFVKLTYRVPAINLNGAGTEEDPYQLKTADDFATIQKMVNESGMSLGGLYFRMTQDILLPDGWEPIGKLNTDQTVFAFSGILDGDGHTLSYSKGSKPLFNFVSDARIENLCIYGQEIDGNGLIDSSFMDRNRTAVTLDKITLKSGTSTLKSGLIGGTYTYTNPVFIRNCKAEEGVIIGYDRSQHGIGTFVGDLIGRVENCSSYATVYGQGAVGGIVGRKSEAMGMFQVCNCSFFGNVEATGDYVGGVVGSGYKADSAPNTPAVSIENCYATGLVKGSNYVGGIFGGEGGLEQCWENGIGYIRNNHFCGTLSATAQDAIAGGIIGYMNSLNKYNIILNNYYLSTCGVTKGIGGVRHIDTSALEYGFHDDVFYYDTSKDDLAAIKLIVDGADDPYQSVVERGLNRTDDPLGKDADRLSKAMTEEEFRDGTVVKLLNGSESSLHNWEQGKKYPVHSSAPIVYELTVSGEYKTTYLVGEPVNSNTIGRITGVPSI